MPVDLLSTLLPAVAEAVLSYALDKLDPADRIRSWLKLGPARLAYQKALARAYTAFARQFPELTTSLFDESFLKSEAAPELAKQLTRHHSPDPAHLTELWVESFWSKLLPETPERGEQKQALIKRHIQPASEFLRWLEAELKAEQVFGPLFDSRALESLPAIEARLDELTAELQRGFEIALNAASQYHSVITVHNYNYFFADGFEALDEFYIRPTSVFQRVRVGEFVGRVWLEEEVDSFINDPERPSGAFIIISDAGVGKTSFAAHLVQTRNYLHLFADVLGGEEKLPAAIRSLSAQLISRYRIEPYASRDALPTEPSQFDTFLEKILRQAADKLTCGEKIVIVCDALDEAGTAPGGNVFGLPRQLPEGVFFILTRRPAPLVKLSLEPLPEPLELKAQSDENLEDVRRFLLGKARTSAIAGQLVNRYSETQFVEALTEKSEGLWIYLRYVLEEIGGGQRRPLELEKLPKGLSAYYADYWGDWREGRNGRGQGRAKWNSTYAPLLCTLAAAREPMPAALLAEWAGVDIQECELLLAERWRPYLREQDRSGDFDYALYHASLRDFLTGRMDRAGIQPEQEWIARDLVKGTTKAHQRIVEYYRRQCNGDWPKLVDDDYARRHLAAHLAGAGRHEELFALVAQSNAWAEARYQKEESYAEYLIDLDLAWRWAEGAQAWNVGRQIRCALIESSLHSLAGNLSPRLLFQVVEAGLWSAARALAHIPQMPDESRRAEALTKINPLLPDALKAEALQAARAITDEHVRASALSNLAPHLPDPLKAEVLSEALQAARAITGEDARASALSGLAQHLPDPLKAEVLSEALQATRAITAEGARASALSNLAPHLPDPLTAEALQAARAITNEIWRARALSGLAPHLPDPLKAEALQAARAITDEYWRACALSGLAPHLPDPLKAEALSEALQAARAITDEGARAKALSGLAPHLPDPLKAEVLSEALQATRAITRNNAQARADALSDLAPHLPDPLKAEALQAARTITDEYARALALSGLAPHLSDPLKAEALQAARAMTNDNARALALRSLAPHLPDPLKAEVLSEALQAARAITDEDMQAFALRALAQHLSDPLKAEVLSEALQAARAITDKGVRAEALSDLAPHLPDPLKAEVLLEAFLTVRKVEVRGLHEPEPERAELYKNILPAWKELSFVGLGDGRVLWPETLHALARHRRAKLLDDLTALLPLIEHLGGGEAVQETFLAMRDVARWWP